MIRALGLDRRSGTPPKLCYPLSVLNRNRLSVRKETEPSMRSICSSTCLLAGVLLLAVAMSCSPAQAGRKSTAAKNKKPKLTKVALEFPKLRTTAEAEKLTAAIRKLPGVALVIVDPRTRLSVVDFDPKKVDLEKLIKASNSVGQSARLYVVARRFPKPIKIKGG